MIAYGNSLRRDDGAGLMLGQMLERDWRTQGIEVQRISVHQLTPELAVEIAREDVSAVVFVDARVIAPDELDPGVELHPITYEIISPSLGHHSDPTALLICAGILYGKQPPAWKITVPGIDFSHGEGLSEITTQALAAVQPVDLYTSLSESRLQPVATLTEFGPAKASTPRFC